MIKIDSAEILVKQVFVNYPNAIVNIYLNDEVIAILAKEDIKRKRYKHIMELLKKYKPPMFVEMGGIPGILEFVDVRIEELIQIGKQASEQEVEE